MKQFHKQLIFVASLFTILIAGGLGIRAVGNIKIDPSKTAKVKMVKQENTTTTGNNPVGWWKMDEGTGTTTADSSGNGNTGTLTNGPTWTTGKLGRGLSFDGSDDYVSIPVMTISRNAGAISFWVYTNKNFTGQYNNQGHIIGRSIVGPYYQYLGLRGGAANTYQLQGETNVNAEYFVNASSPVTKNQWTNIAVSFNSGVATSYVNGVQVDQKTGLTSDWTINRIGLDEAITPFAGTIDDVRIYNRALTAGEVGQMYNSTKDGYLGKIKVSTGLVGYWKLDDNNALTSVIDYSGKGNTGTAYSGTATSTSVLSTSTAMVGRAMSFDGVDDYVKTSNLNNTCSSFTISFWFKSNRQSPTNNELLIDIATSTTGGRQVAIQLYQNAIWVYLKKAAASYPNKLSFSDTTKFHHLSMTYNGSTILLYLDGVLGTTNNTVESIDMTNAPITIGILYTLTSNAFQGILDDIRIYNRTLTATEIEQSYQRGLMGKEQ